MTAARATRLPTNQLDHFYRGGDRIGALRGGPGGPMRPEEWIASTVTRFGEVRAGLSALPDGTLLRDAVRADPEAWFGPAHVAAFGASTELLVKLLDPDQRLPVHFHPDRAFARRHLGLDHGKTEAWVVLDAAPGAGVGLGFATPMRRGEVADLVARRDAPALVRALHRHVVARGDVVLVPAGVPHAIDAGVFVLELQEPTDLSILLEWEGFAIDGARDGHLGLGFDIALGALRLTPLDAEERHTLVRRDALSGGDVRSLFHEVADRWFRATLLPAAGGALPAGFAVVLVLAGTGTFAASHGETFAVRRGDALVVPWASGAWSLSGVDAVACRPPAP